MRNNIYSLPRDRESSMTSFYGQPGEQCLEWFVCPAEFRYAGKLLIRHRCHRNLTERLESALQAVSDSLGPVRWLTEGWGVYDGCFFDRPAKGGGRRSTHAWGAAIDVCAANNPWKSANRTLSDDGIDIMEYHGFLSGGRAWGHDWMHFQAAIPSISPNSHYAKNGLPKNIIAARV